MAHDLDPSNELDPPLPNRVPVLRLAASGFVVAMVLLLGPMPLEGRLGSAIGDLAHAPMFGGICISTWYLWHSVSPLRSFTSGWSFRIFVVAIGAFLAGITIELIQSLTGRMTAFHDVVANGLGILAACSLCIGTLNRLYRPSVPWLTFGSRVLAVVLVGLAMSHPLTILADIYAAKRAYPVINSFESVSDVTRWYLDDSSTALVDTHVTDGQHAMRWTIQDGEHPAITLTETVADWSRVESLELDVTLAPDFPGTASLYVKVMDSQHADYHEDVCRKEFLLNPGESRHLSVSRAEIIDGPDTRTLDLANIKYVSLMVYRPGAATWIDVDAIRVKLREE